uniref:Integral membrane protein n=1 Tax=uncultured bacterium contig00094 TaxID=1181565 RepID=A0A806K1Q6_9BACT|nr:integral membrane protein [uncultured bacterium contig00094]
MNPKENYELRAQARGQLKGVWNQMVLAMLVYFAITFTPLFIFSEGSPLQNATLESIINVLVSVASGPFALGLAGYFLKRVRGEEFAISNIFDGFKRFIPSFLLCLFMYLFVFLWCLLLIIPGIIKSFSYSMAYYIIYDDPNVKPLEALKKSQVMMKGYKWKYFTLQLSFIGWGLLCLLTLGIGFLWLVPYMYLSYANFYEDIKRNQQPRIEDNTQG